MSSIFWRPLSVYFKLDMACASSKWSIVADEAEDFWAWQTLSRLILWATHRNLRYGEQTNALVSQGGFTADLLGDSIS